MNPENFTPHSSDPSAKKPLRILIGLFIIFILGFSFIYLIYFVFTKKPTEQPIQATQSSSQSQSQAQTQTQTQAQTQAPLMTFTPPPGTLIFAIDIIRHGDRTPTMDPFSKPDTWPQGLGQLTALGMNQEYLLGQALRNLYIDQTHLLSAQYQAGTIYIQSTDYDRTLMSAESLLAGLYPLGTGPMLAASQPALPQAQQPVPIHIFPLTQQNKIIPDSNPLAYQTLLKNYVFNTPEWIKKENALKAKFPLWSKALGIKINHLYDLKNIADTLYIQKIHGVKYPNGLSPTDVDQIIEAGQWAFVAGFKNPTVGKITGHYFLNLIGQEIKNYPHANTPTYLLYSTHDSVILALMSALGSPMDTVPTYASDLNFLVFTLKTPSGDTQKMIQIRLNGDPISVPACKSNLALHACTLNEFLALTSDTSTAKQMGQQMAHKTHAHAGSSHS